MKMVFEDLGQVDYLKAWEYQKRVFNGLIASKLSGKTTENKLLFCEHPHVYTLGKSGNRQNLLINDEMLKKIGASYYHIDRGGDITYHGPGQLVGYPLFDLDSINISIKEFVYNIEEILIRTVAGYGIEASRIEKAAGVWVDAGNAVKARKIAAIGMKIHKKVSMHGFALNVNTDLNYFSYIIPCGLKDKGVTSINRETGKKIDIQEVKSVVAKNFKEIFGFK
jgi:lipoyl(octanoyl) transferase